MYQLHFPIRFQPETDLISKETICIKLLLFYSNSGRAGFLKLSICYVLPPPHYLFSVYLQSIKESVTKIALLPTCKEAD